MVKKNLFILLIVLMILSLIGILFVQGFWITSRIQNEEEQFSFAVKQALVESFNKLQSIENQKYYAAFESLTDTIDRPSASDMRKFIVGQKEQADNPLLPYAGFIIKEDYKEISEIYDFTFDSITFTNLINERVRIYDQKNDRSVVDVLESSYKKVKYLTDYEINILEPYITELKTDIPIYRRFKQSDLSSILKSELVLRDIHLPFEFAIYNRDVQTKISTPGFSLDDSGTYGINLDSSAQETQISDYTLFVNMKNKKRFILSSIAGMTILSILFVFIIFLTFIYALSQLFQQRQNSQIKSDFINNMTHEFKTPIATINLALDALKNPKVKGNQETTNRYMKMIREENKRMHSQVENVLQISKLEKGQLDLKKEVYDVHELLDDAASHLELLLAEKNGVINTAYKATRAECLISESHMSNVFVNIIENAIKYSEESPIINIETSTAKNHIIIQVSDNGIGMSKTAQKRVFEKFYREPKGNIHNVKGHGLGLAYAKRIIDDHHGDIWVSSELGSGSMFTVKLPILT